MRWMALVLSTTLMLCCGAAAAEAEEVPSHEPEVTQVPSLLNLPDGVKVTARAPLDLRAAAEYKCYTPQEYQALAHMVIDYRWLHGYAMRLELMLENKGQEILRLEGQLAAVAGQVKILERERTFMDGLYDEEHRLRIGATREAKAKQWLLVAGNVVLGAATVALSIYAGVK